MKYRTRRIAIELATGLAIGATFLCMGCGAETEEKVEAPIEEATLDSTIETETESAAVSEATAEITAEEQTEEIAEEVISTWTAEGNYIDDAGNQLVMYRTYEEFGYSKDGWGAMFHPGDEIYSGDLDEVDGKLFGTISAHADDGTPTDGIALTLTELDGSILLQKENGEEMTFLPDDTDYSDPDFLPMFSYNQVLADSGYDPLEAAAYDYLSFDYTNDYDTRNVIIPYVEIVDVDEKNPKDVLLYGDYYAWEFKKEDDALVAVSGGHCPGIIHLERSGNGDAASYSPTGTMDEAFTDEDTKTLFGEFYDEYHEISSDGQLRDPKIAQVIADYVAANDLEITGYQFGGEAAKELPGPRTRH